MLKLPLIAICYLRLQREFPVFLGPCLIHSGQEYNSYYRLPESMIKANQKCRNILVFATDAEKNIYQVFQDILSNAYHLLCDIHMKKNI